MSLLVTPFPLPVVPPGAPVARIIGAINEFIGDQQISEDQAALIWQQIQPILWQMVTLELQARGAGECATLTDAELDALIQEEVAEVRQARFATRQQGPATSPENARQ